MKKVVEQSKPRQSPPSVEAVYEHGIFRVLRPERLALDEGQRVRLFVETEGGTDETDSLELLAHMYDGLSEEEIDEIEKIMLDRSNFFRDRPLP
jgi:predicted DNA-binding antitoxin AbrB/MazE fold protein